MKIKKYSFLEKKPKPYGRPDGSNPLTDINLFYEHEIPEHKYTYKDALEVFVNREMNPIEFNNKKGQPEYTNIEETAEYKRAKKNLDELISAPGVDSNIPKKLWDKFSNFVGINPQKLHHPHFYLAFEKEMEVLEKCDRAEDLLVCHCSRVKPYIKNSNYTPYVKASRELRLFDVCVLSLYPTFLYPYDCSTKYPHICYDWPHLESPGMLYHYESHNLRMLIEVIRRLKYKRVIFLEFGQMKHIDILKTKFGFTNYIDIKDCEPYAKLHREIFKLPILSRMRLLSGSYASALFLKDIYGSKMEGQIGTGSKLFGCNGNPSWDFVPDEIKEKIGYPNGILTPDSVPSCIDEW